ncbi:MAG: porin [Burkholderiaceae bacterium]|nr:porin [Burkholderiaceae bacterium]
MNILRVALAIFSLGPLCAAAQAQSALQVYGVLDAGVVAERGCVGGADCDTTRVSSGVASASRLGLAGREALGGETAAVFTLEAGILGDTGRADPNGTLFGRQAYVGLDGRLGALTLGRQYNLQYLALVDVADPFKGGLAGSARNLVGYTAERYDNAIQYRSPRRHGLIAGVIYSFGESVHSSAANRAYAATLGYANSRVNVTVARQRKNNFIAAASLPGLDLSATNTLVAANVKLGPATAFAAYGRNKGAGSSPWDASNPYGALVSSTPSTDSRDVLLGLSAPYGASTFMASYIRKDDHNLANRDANQIAVGMTYALSRRTDFYASFAKIQNRNGAGYAVGNATEAGRGERAVNIGLRHAF